MTSCLPDGKNWHIFADQEDMTADMTTITYFTCMVKIVALKFNTPFQPKKFGSLLSVLSDLECYVYKRNYFNQNLLKLRYMLSQTDICNISAHSDHGHFCWASRKTSFQCLHLHRAAINIGYEKMSGTSSLSEISINWFAEKLLII